MQHVVSNCYFLFSGCYESCQNDVAKYSCLLASTHIQTNEMHLQQILAFQLLLVHGISSNFFTYCTNLQIISIVPLQTQSPITMKLTKKNMYIRTGILTLNIWSSTVTPLKQYKNYQILQITEIFLSDSIETSENIDNLVVHIKQLNTLLCVNPKYIIYSNTSSQ